MLGAEAVEAQLRRGPWISSFQRIAATPVALVRYYGAYSNASRGKRE